jgi:hypothetical protein
VAVQHLAHPIPPKTLDRNLLIATWNIRHFGGVTEKWTTDPEDSPKRNLPDRIEFCYLDWARAESGARWCSIT